jgi:hypothetical protein
MNDSNTDATMDFIARRVGAENLVGSRALAFGGAGASLALILLIAQIGVTKWEAVWSLGLVAVALPLWLAVALTYDVWLSLGLGSVEFYTRKGLPRMQLRTIVVALFLTFLSIGFLLHAFSPLACLVFIITSAIGIVMVYFAIKEASFHILRLMGAPPK